MNPNYHNQRSGCYSKPYYIAHEYYIGPRAFVSLVLCIFVHYTIKKNFIDWMHPAAEDADSNRTAQFLGLYEHTVCHLLCATAALGHRS